MKIQRKDIHIKKLEITSTLTEYNKGRLQIECDEIKVRPQDGWLEDALNEEMDSVVLKDIYDPFDGHEETFEALKVYIPKLSNSLIRKHLPEKKDD
jgi:hypothetical protein